MPRKTNTPSTTSTPAASPTPSPIAKAQTTHVFARSKEERRSGLTHEQIEDHLAAFARSGGKIEVLGTTFTFKSIGPKKPAASTTIESTDETSPTLDASDHKAD
jgi:hypothetical protein